MRSMATVEQNPIKIAVIGGGSWATAIVKILSEANVNISWWLRSQSDIAHIQQFAHNPSYLSGVGINLKKVQATHSLTEAIAPAKYVVLAVPAAFITDVLGEIDPEIFHEKHIVSAIKGMIPTENLLITDWLEKHKNVLPQAMSVIAGPCHAEEVALEKQSYLTIASPNLQEAQAFSRLMACRFVKTSAIQDIYGVEYCAVIKNIIALACGICHGLGYGDNFQAVLVANALQEIRAFLDNIYPHYRHLDGSAYLGDLLVTSYSQFSRNRTFGNMIGRGYSIKAAQMEMNMVAEGFYAVKCIWEISRQYHVEMPITKATYRVLYEGSLPSIEMTILKNVMK